LILPPTLENIRFGYMDSNEPLRHESIERIEMERGNESQKLNFDHPINDYLSLALQPCENAARRRGRGEQVCGSREEN
jgi:hypothetical protein